MLFNDFILVMDEDVPIDDGVAVIICRLVGAQCVLYVYTCPL